MTTRDGLLMKYFVLKPAGTDIFAQASRRAMRSYAALIESENPEFASELREWADREFAAAIDAGMHAEVTDRWGPSIPMEIGDALAAHDAALAQKLLTSFTEQTAKLEADNAKLREELDWALGIVQVSPARLNKSQDERYSQARALLAESPETQGKETA